MTLPLPPQPPIKEPIISKLGTMSMAWVTFFSNLTSYLKTNKDYVEAPLDGNAWLSGLSQAGSGAANAILNTVGARPPTHVYIYGTEWSDLAADKAIIDKGLTKVDGDRVTISGTGYAMVKYWDTLTGSWIPDGAVIDGNLIVTNTITTNQINSNGLTIRDPLGNVILDASTLGNNISYSNVAGGPPIGATANANTYSTVDPTGGNDGDSWYNSTTKILWYKTGGTWFKCLPQFTSANVSTYIASAAIGDAQIGSLAAGKITAGSLTVGLGVGTSGYINSGQTAFNTGTGFWLEGGTTPKFSFGDSTNNINWNGSALSVNGSVINTGNINADQSTSIRVANSTTVSSVGAGSSIDFPSSTGISIPAVSSVADRGDIVGICSFQATATATAVVMQIIMQYSIDGGTTWISASGSYTPGFIPASTAAVTTVGLLAHNVISKSVFGTYIGAVLIRFNVLNNSTVVRNMGYFDITVMEVKR